MCRIAKFVEPIKTIAKEAGEIILDVYKRDFSIDTKDDNSPLTEADLKANAYIVSHLAKLTPDIPIVSEENDEASNIRAMQSPTFWLVDPLDGTKSFIKRSGEFTVNIALIDHNHTVLGCIYVPVGDALYWGSNDGAYKSLSNQTPTSITTRTPPSDGVVVIASHSHRSAKTQAYIDQLPNLGKTLSVSSSLKFCTIAEGAADIYPRFGPTMQWDTAAGQAIVEAAGGFVGVDDRKALTYGGDALLNPYFMVYGKKP